MAGGCLGYVASGSTVARKEALFSGALRYAAELAAGNGWGDTETRRALGWRMAGPAEMWFVRRDEKKDAKNKAFHVERCRMSKSLKGL